MSTPVRQLIIIFCAAFIWCSSQVLSAQDGFSPMRQEVGISHLYDPMGHLGGGAVVFDMNNDGFMDLFLPGGNTTNKILLNDNGETFIDITSATGIGILNNIYVLGGVSGDFNRDGFDDLFLTTWRYITTWGGPNFNISNLMLLNNGDNTFMNVSGFYGILHPALSASATLLDVNQDGFLDIYVANYVENSQLIFDESNQVSGFAHQCYNNFLYVSDNGQGYYEEAEDYGVNDNGCGLAVAAGDILPNGHQDIVVVNDFGQWVEPNTMYKNSGGSFEDISEISQTDIGLYGMGIAVGDYDENGHMDFYITNMGRNALLRHQELEQWTDATNEAGVENEFTGDLLTTGWGTFFFDFDNDSHLDLYVSNGHIPAAPFIQNALYDSNKLYRNNTDGTFEDVTELANLMDTAMGRGAVVFDFNNDGKLDIIQVNIEHPFNQAQNGTVLYLNETENDNNFVMFHLKGTTVNTNAIGARVQLYAHNRMLLRLVDGGSSHASHNDKRIHYGLGEINEIDSVLIYWPGMPTPQVLNDPEINQIHTVVQEDVVTDVQLLTEKTVQLYPNPTSRILSLQYRGTNPTNLNLTLSDLNGKTLLQEQQELSGKSMINLDHWLQSLISGVYILSVQQGDQIIKLRLVVTK